MRWNAEGSEHPSHDGFFGGGRGSTPPLFFCVQLRPTHAGRCPPPCAPRALCRLAARSSPETACTPGFNRGRIRAKFLRSHHPTLDTSVAQAYRSRVQYVFCRRALRRPHRYTTSKGPHPMSKPPTRTHLPPASAQKTTSRPPTPQRPTTPAAPPAYRPQPTQKVLQRKDSLVQSSPSNVRKSAPAAPPAYSPRPAPRVLQTKAGADCRHQQTPQAGQRPTAPPLNHPAQKKVVQPMSMANTSARKLPKAPPVYRPQPAPKVLQTKATTPDRSINQSRIAPTVKPTHRPPASPAPGGVERLHRCHAGRQPGATQCRAVHRPAARIIQRTLQPPKTPPNNVTLDLTAIANLHMAVDGDTLIGIMNHNSGVIFLHHVDGSKGKSTMFQGTQKEPLKRPQQGGPAPNHQQVREFYDSAGNDADYVGFTVHVHADNAPLTYDWVSRSLNEPFNQTYQTGGRRVRLLDSDLQPGIQVAIDAEFQEAVRNRQNHYPAPQPPPSSGSGSGNNNNNNNNNNSDTHTMLMYM